MSTIRILTFALLSSISAMADSNPVNANALPKLTAAGASAAANATLPVSPMPEEKRTFVLVAGIAAVLVTFQQAFSRKRPSA